MHDEMPTSNSSESDETSVWNAVNVAIEEVGRKSALMYRALIVDDEPIVRKRNVLCLGQEGFDCETAGDGSEALEKIAANRYDVVVTDLLMPNRHGHWLAVELLKDPQRPLIVVLTAVEDPRMVKDLILRGVDDVMFKPVNHQAFAAKIKALVRRRDATPAEGVTNTTVDQRHSVSAIQTGH